MEYFNPLATALCSVCVFAMAGAASGAELRVGEGGYATIQDAVDAANANDIIYVDAGVYDSGGGDSTSSGNSNRVEIVGKPGLRLVGAGKGRSIIRGSRPAGTGAAFSANARSGYPVRCLRVQSSAGVVIEGFTIELGETKSANESGGGLYSHNNATYLVDCEIRDCSAKYGAATYGGTCVRCVVDDVFGTTGAASYGGTFVNCAISRAKLSGGSGAAFDKCSLYNCTVADNATISAIKNGSKAYNCVVVLSANGLSASELDSPSADSAENSVLGSVDGHVQLMGPAVGDLHLAPGSAALGAGLYANLSALSLPEGVSAFVDLAGEAILPDGEGRINAGAYQTPGVPAAGTLFFTNAYHSVNGRISKNQSLFTYVTPTNYPVQYRVFATPSSASYHFMRWKRSVDSDFTYADMNGGEWIMPPPDPACTNVYTVETAGNIYYVDSKNGDDGNDGKTEAAAFKTIAHAVSSVNASWNAIIYVKPGTYAEGGNTFTRNSTTYGEDARFAVDNAKLLIRSTDGAASTVIVGGSSKSPTDADNYPGCGVGAKRIAVLRNSCAIQGFTLTGGHSVDSDTTGIVSGMTVGKIAPVVIDCIASNNVSMTYASSVNCIRCRFYDNVSSRDVLSGVAAFCHVRGNVVRTSGFGAIRQYAVFCTAVGDVGTGNLSTLCSSYNSIWDGGAQISAQWTPYGSVFSNYGSSSASGSFVSADPYFVSRSGGAEILAASSAIGAGIVPTIENCSSFNWYLYCVGDVDGNPICWNGDRPTAGASQAAPVPCVSVAAAANGGIAVSGAPVGISALDENTTLTITPAAGTRPCIGVAVNGEERPFTNYWPYAISLTIADADESGLLSVAPVYSTDWYVDDDGDDSATGFLPKCAKKTLVAGAACLAAGDTLWVLPGTYDSGSNRVGDVTIWSRVVVPANTTVKSTDGPEATIIKGADATIGRDDYGCGTNAIRCVTLDRPNSRLSGFTLTGGRVDRTFRNTLSGMGAGVIGKDSWGGYPDNGVVVENCIISNCAAAVGSAATYCTVVRSRILKNTATSYGTVYGASLYGSLFDGNVGSGVIDHSRDVVECTVTANNLQSNGYAANAMQNPNNGTRLANSLFATPLYVTSENVVGVTNCVLLSTSTLTGPNVALDEASCVVTNDEALAMDANGVPVAGANAAVDAGSADAYRDEYGFLYGERDLRGFQRVMNGAMDAGCFEADWRARYAGDIGNAHRLAVTAASSNVVETASRAVALGPGATLDLTCISPSPKVYRRKVRVLVEGGTLSVLLNGELFASLGAADGVQTLEFANALAANELSFSFASAGEGGSATILSCRSANGAVITFR